MQAIPPKVILHVGMEKAGSTSIQNVLEARAEGLLARGVLFPRSVFTRMVANQPDRTSGHLELLRRIAAGDLGAFEAELAAAEGARTLLLSAENIFHHPDEAALAGLGDLLAGSRVEMIAVLRGQDGWLRSYYNEAVSNGWVCETRSADRFARDMIAEGRLDYAGRLARLERLIGPAETRILNYDAVRRGGGDVVAAFCELAGLDLPERDAAEADAPPALRQSHVTRSYPEAVEAQRRLNPLAAGFWSGEMHAWTARMREIAAELRPAEAGTGAPDPAPEVRREVAGDVWLPNRRLAERFPGVSPVGPDPEWGVGGGAGPLDEALVRRLTDAGLRAFLDLREAAASMRAKPEFPRRYPWPLRPDRAGMLGLWEALQEARVVLFHGGGPELFLAAALPGRFIGFAEPDTGWGAALQLRLDRADPVSPVAFLPDAAAERLRPRPDLVVIGAGAGLPGPAALLESLGGGERVLLLPGADPALRACLEEICTAGDATGDATGGYRMPGDFAARGAGGGRPAA